MPQQELQSCLLNQAISPPGSCKTNMNNYNYRVMAWPCKELRLNKYPRSNSQWPNLGHVFITDTITEMIRIASCVWYQVDEGLNPGATCGIRPKKWSRVKVEKCFLNQNRSAISRRRRSEYWADENNSSYYSIIIRWKPSDFLWDTCLWVGPSSKC